MTERNHLPRLPRKSRWRTVVLALSAILGSQLGSVTAVVAQDPFAVGTVLRGPDGDNATVPYVATDSYLDDLVAPIALYPDDLLAVVLSAARSPGQLAEAARYLEELEIDPALAPNPDWDDAILALLNYPEVLHLLAADIDWTRRLGEAVVVRQAAVMAAAQRVRSRAYAAGNLASDSYQRVERTRAGIVIRPVNPAVIYVPRYEPAMIFVRHNRPVMAYYPRSFPVYYYPYPDGYAFGTDFFWGLSSYFSIGWSTFSLGLIFNDNIGHPYFGSSWRYTTFDRPHRYPVQRRTVTVRVFDRRDRGRGDDRDWDRDRDWNRDRNDGSRDRDRDSDRDWNRDRNDGNRDRDRDSDRDWNRDRNDGNRDRDRDSGRDWRRDDDRDRDNDRRNGDRRGTDAGRNADPGRDGGDGFNRAWRTSDERDDAGARRPPPNAIEQSREPTLPTTRIETRRLRDTEQRAREPDQREADRRRAPGSNAASVRTFEAREPAPSAQPPAEPAARQRAGAGASPDADRSRGRELRRDTPVPAAPAVVPAPAAGERTPGTVNRAWRDATRRDADQGAARTRGAAPAGAPPAYRPPVPQPKAVPQAEAPAKNSGDERGEEPRRRGRGVSGD
ncbi:MAG: DUF3300 domain-containing protein [Gammaproteobacteria bacterium]|nr:DUF3300 domain-containing protein [Gammaproteobacteria bacterium]